MIRSITFIYGAKFFICVFTYKYVMRRVDTASSRKKLTITVDKETLNKAKEVAERKGIPISRIIENFLSFLARPHVYCFKCGARFETNSSEICVRCNWLKCPRCGACGCGLSDETAKAIFEMRKVYEDLLGGKVKIEC